MLDRVLFILTLAVMAVVAVVLAWTGEPEQGFLLALIGAALVDMRRMRQLLDEAREAHAITRAAAESWRARSIALGYKRPPAEPVPDEVQRRILSSIERDALRQRWRGKR